MGAVVTKHNAAGCAPGAEGNRDMAGKADEEILASALAYRRRGWSVVPVEPRGKRPLVRWEAFQKEAASEQQIRDWLRRWPDANLGIVTGAVSGIVVLDVDPRHDGEESLFELTHRHGGLPETPEVLTGGGGRHLYFRHPGQALRNRVAVAAGIDLRGDGGLVVAPPSLHPSAKRYEWEVSHHPDDMAPAAMPEWLLALCRGETRHTGHPLSYWRALAREGVAEGARNNTVASLTGHLLFRGVDPEVALELLLCWNRVRCRPPLDDEEVVQTVDSIARTHFRHAQD
jgi:hypothetical protein